MHRCRAGTWCGRASHANFVKAVQVLCDGGGNFVIIGGWSAIFNGRSYMTNDLVICFARDRQNCKRTAFLLAPIHPRLRDLPSDLPFIWDATTLQNAEVLTLTSDLGSIDLLTELRVSLGSFAAVKRSSFLVHAFDRDVWTLDLPGLIQAKRPTGRPKPELESLWDAAKPDSA